MNKSVSIKTSFKIGTRGSLLALTQCTQTKDELEQKSGQKFELVPITTQGDQITDKPLWQIDGKDFFTKELDQALLENKVDLVVHSYKDLGSLRPDGIELASITKRKFAQDILLIKKERVSQIKDLDNFIVGTSSPRRTVNIQKNLRDFLPGAKETLTIQIENLRGNVNTRIEKLKTQNYDAIVLALAGIERLANKEDSRQTLAELLEGLTFMVLPQKFFTSAASQGALAIECSENASEELKSALQTVHDEQTAQEMEIERAAFQSYGGGCHLAVGINVRKVRNYLIEIHNGRHEERDIHKIRFHGFDYTPYRGKKLYQVYKDNDFLTKKEKINTPVRHENIFVTSTHCLHNVNDKASSIWASGNHTMKKLVARGFWVNGCAEGLGHQEIINFKASKAIELMLSQSSWKILSHDHASSVVGELVPCYQHSSHVNFDTKKRDEMLASDIIYWSSKVQYDLYTQTFPELKNKIHAIGLGKTYSAFREENIPFIPCLDMKHLEISIAE